MSDDSPKLEYPLKLLMKRSAQRHAARRRYWLARLYLRPPLVSSPSRPITRAPSELHCSHKGRRSHTEDLGCARFTGRFERS
jgi:hypothetical protein